jgi:ABC-type transport system involved in multi-copper enzyme maturation permease subunit
LRPILAIAGTTVGEAIRRKVLLILLLIGTLILIIVPGLGVLSARAETTILKSTMLGIIQITSAVIAIVLTVYMIPNEIERRTIYTILSKPVQRWQFLLGKYFGAVAALGLMMALMSAIMVLVFWYQQGNAAEAASLVRAPVMYFVQMSLLAAVAIFFSTFVTPLVNFFLTGGVYMLGTMFNPFFMSLDENKGAPAVAKMIAKIVNLIIPNFANFNVQNSLVNSQQTIGSETEYYLRAIGYGLMYIGVLLVGGMLIFDRREV